MFSLVVCLLLPFTGGEAQGGAALASSQEAGLTCCHMETFSAIYLWEPSIQPLLPISEP